MANIPIGWNISIDNDPSWNTSISGSIRVGAAALDASFFREFLVIEKDESLGLPFNAEGEVVVTQDFSKERKNKSLDERHVDSTSGKAQIVPFLFSSAFLSFSTSPWRQIPWAARLRAYQRSVNDFRLFCFRDEQPKVTEIVDKNFRAARIPKVFCR